MKRIIINSDNLTDANMDYEVIRSKGLIINNKNEVLLAHNNGTYQFPGGHNENGESLETTLIREIKEETGIDINVDYGPFMQITTYDPDYMNTSKKVCNKIYYYRVLCDQVPNPKETCYDELESQSEFRLLYIPIDELECFLHKSMNAGSVDSKIGKEMLLVLNHHLNLFRRTI